MTEPVLLAGLKRDGPLHFQIRIRMQVRTAQYVGSNLPFTSNMTLASLMELNYLMLKGADGSEVALKVTGVARVPKFDSYWVSGPTSLSLYIYIYYVVYFIYTIPYIYTFSTG